MTNILDSMLQDTRCDLCGKRMQVGLQPWHWRCTDCSLERSSLTPHINDANTMDELERTVALRALREQNFTTLLAWLSNQYPKDFPALPRLLEVGCAHGWFLELARDSHCTLGIEPDAAIAEISAARGLNVRQGFFPHALAENETFDTIVFNDVLEHIPDVRTVLACCHAHLSPGGYLIVNAPDSKGLFYRVSQWLARLGRSDSFDRMWQLGLPSPHLYYFNNQTIEKLAHLSGFKIQASCHLPAVQTKGLAERIHYAGGTSRLQARVMAGAIAAAMPLVRLSPPDIRVWLLKKNGLMRS